MKWFEKKQSAPINFIVDKDSIWQLISHKNDLTHGIIALNKENYHLAEQSKKDRALSATLEQENAELKKQIKELKEPRTIADVIADFIYGICDKNSIGEILVSEKIKRKLYAEHFKYANEVPDQKNSIQGDIVGVIHGIKVRQVNDGTQLAFILKEKS